MENISNAAIDEYVVTLIEQKYPGQPLDNFKDFREKSVQSINDAVYDAIFDGLNSEQLDEINVLLDDENQAPSIFADFFRRAGVDIEQKTTEVLEKFKTQFLGGSNE